MSKIAVLGYGVVGSGTVELFYKNKENIIKKAGKDLDIKYILDIREFPDSPYADKFVKNIDVIINDEEVEIVAEVMGGVNPAFDFVSRCLKAGKSVVSSNKELVAKKGAELLRFAKENNCNFFFEASVGGAIPIIRPIHQCLAANDISCIQGILNGTTNFIITKMINDKMEFNDALSMAQKLGYAEKDPTADVEGYDACRKVCILSSLVYGKHVYPESVHTEGISKITIEDVLYAKSWGGSVKLIGSVNKLNNGKILPMVRPAFVSSSNPLSNISDVFNGILVKGDAIDQVMFYGRGAGKLPTASAVVADIIDAAKQNYTSISQTWEDSSDTSFIEDYKNSLVSMYVRIQAKSIANAKTLLEKNVGNVDYLDREGKDANELAFITPKMLEKDIDSKLECLADNDISILSEIRVLD